MKKFFELSWIWTRHLPLRLSLERNAPSLLRTSLLYFEKLELSPSSSTFFISQARSWDLGIWRSNNSREYGWENRIRVIIRVILSGRQHICKLACCIGEDDFVSQSLSLFAALSTENSYILHYILKWLFDSFVNSNTDHSLRICKKKKHGNHLLSWQNDISLLWHTFNRAYSLLWQWFRVEFVVAYSNLFSSHRLTPKILSITLKHWQKLLWIVVSRIFLIEV